MIIALGNIFRKHKNPGAFRGVLHCPLCKSLRNEFVENITPFRLRYRCKDCKQTFQYDISGRPSHPYGVFNKTKWQQLVERSKRK